MKNHYIISNFLKASKTFDIYSAVFSHLNMDHVYLPKEIRTREASKVSLLEIDALSKFISDFRNNEDSLSIVISNPFKPHVHKFCDELSPEVKRMGVSNLIIKKNNMLIAKNIDGLAFSMGQKRTLSYDFSLKNILILGCGGVSTAVSFKLIEEEVASLTLFDLIRDKAKRLQEKLDKYKGNTTIIVVDDLMSYNLSKVDCIYNGTGVGKTSDNPNSILKSPINFIPKIDSQDVLLIDANYTPWETEFLRMNKYLRGNVLNGFSHMLAFTSLHMSEIVGKRIDFEVIKKIAEDIICQKK